MATRLTETRSSSQGSVRFVQDPDRSGWLLSLARGHHRDPSLGGALARPPKIPNAVAHTTRQFQLYSGGVLGIGQDDAVHAAHDLLVHTLAPWHSGARTLNFMAGIAHTSAEDVRQAFTPEDYAQLVATKQAHDPTNMFRFNHNIPPGCQ